MVSSGRSTICQVVVLSTGVSQRALGLVKWLHIMIIRTDSTIVGGLSQRIGGLVKWLHIMIIRIDSTIVGDLWH